MTWKSLLQPYGSQLLSWAVKEAHKGNAIEGCEVFIYKEVEVKDGSMIFLGFYFGIKQILDVTI